MAAGDTKQGRRLEVVVVDGRADLNQCLPTEPGDYVGPITGYTGDAPGVWFRLPVADDHPDAGVRHVTAPPHAFTEEPDGSLTVSPSILARRASDADVAPWHGYLERGVWREV